MWHGGGASQKRDYRKHHRRKLRPTEPADYDLRAGAALHSPLASAFLGMHLLLERRPRTKMGHKQVFDPSIND
jgi:hypothetical protein